jgi:aminoglycoside phosphotransferase family enzyme
MGRGGRTVDWLVKMRRLPAALMFDQALATGVATEADVRRIAAKLARFYRESCSVEMDPSRYWAQFMEAVTANLRELTRPAYSLPGALVHQACAAQSAFLEGKPELLEARARDNKIIEAHGDLRAEHICLEPEPVIIDCLEFKREFRLLDPADELGFLAMDCERLGASFVRDAIFDVYGRATGDFPPDQLVHFYQSYRACLRAKIAVWHMNEPNLPNAAKWVGLARDYLKLAMAHIERCR